MVRALLQTDIPACAKLISTETFFVDYGIGATKLTQSLDEALANPNAEQLAAVSNGNLVGFAWFVKRGAFDRSGYLRFICVAKNAKRHGVA